MTIAVSRLKIIALYRKKTPKITCHLTKRYHHDDNITVELY